MYLSIPTIWQRFFAVIQTLQCLVVSSNHLDIAVTRCVIKSFRLFSDEICIYTMECFNYLLLWAYIKTCPAMPLHTSLTHHLFIYMLLKHYPLQHVSVTDPRMERASNLQLWSTSKAYHLFHVEHIWKEVLGLCWQCREWWCKLAYLGFINGWLQWQYYSNTYSLITASVPLHGMDRRG
jgi:hypothetical protein